MQAFNDLSMRLIVWIPQIASQKNNPALWERIQIAIRNIPSLMLAAIFIGWVPLWIRSSNRAWNYLLSVVIALLLLPFLLFHSSPPLEIFPP